ncbi:MULTISPECIES: F0F1 ATP synthase subunit A [Tenacibaculum]|uniref:ATP synthase subunit a n=1 Tax=Tenacibaculum aiptasiae TaxID=426481 RepID=A0A7J5AMZ6_9FLAO|nr:MULTISPECIES: F0F1 ATP synthase subunit A [Tenacibaculum]KAB1158978.1 F0F1 ATP synthase subunit A [Tenacibaculum aiptasiae]MCF2876089.1 F0F1 ATP synthase subunit A [Tenacibaculum sp. Cn5-1]MCF2936164.1 F0F1 ATP synthase subunit A [Tenacibaculum sp. Cn5-34]MCG7512725.1 F0F1 ATP synthase subunit A [Tenacibaculum sp. Cn5-46]
MMIAQKSIKFFTVLALVFTSFTAFAGGGEKKSSENDGGRVNTKKEINDYIKHHLADSHDFAFYSYTNDAGERKHVGFPLPVIVKTSKGIKFFMSSKFHHNDDGTVIVDAGDVKLVKIHSKIYELNEGATEVAFDETHHATNAHKVLDFSITKSVFGMLFAGLLMFLGFNSLAKGYKKGAIPTGVGRVLEPLVLYVRDEIARPNIGEKKYKRFMPYLLTVFFFIWILNLLGLTPLGFNVTGQIAVTACLAIFTLVVYISSGTKDFWMHTLWMPGVPKILRPVLAIIELIGFILIKPFSLLVRLFANITAGHFVVMSLIALMMTLKAQFGGVASTGISLVLTLFISVIEILVAFLQAFIFTMLSALFIGMAVEEHDHEHADAH